MVDISRNAVLRPEAARKLIRLCALMGYSFVGLYMEDTIDIPGEPYFGYQRGAMTPEELKDLDQYAAGLGLELRPICRRWPTSTRSCGTSGMMKSAILKTSCWPGMSGRTVCWISC